MRRAGRRTWSLIAGSMVAMSACKTTDARQSTDVTANPEQPKVMDAAAASGTLTILATTEPELAAVGQRRLSYLMGRDDELSGWVLPLLQSYLPETSRVTTRIYLGAKLKDPLTIGDSAVFVDVTSPLWGDAYEAMWNTIVRALYRATLTAELKDDAQVDQSEVQRLLLERLMVEGMVNFVAAQGRPEDAGRTDYQIIERRDEVARRFETLDDVTRAVDRGESTKDAMTKLDEEDAKTALYGVTGATMANEIERTSGRAALVEAVAKGPKAFYDAYQSTGPGAQLNFGLPAPRAGH